MGYILLILILLHFFFLILILFLFLLLPPDTPTPNTFSVATPHTSSPPKPLLPLKPPSASHCLPSPPPITSPLHLLLPPPPLPLPYYLPLPLHVATMLDGR